MAKAARQYWTHLRLKLLQRLLTPPSASADVPSHLATGHRGELAAYFELRRRGYVVVARGWRSHIVRGDLDLIAWDAGTLSFIEVKTRTTRSFAPAEAAVDQEKQRNLCRLARHYLRQLNQPKVESRFDVISIYFDHDTPQIEIIRNAFDWA